MKNNFEYESLKEGMMMKKELEVNSFLFPMPVLMIATYCEDGTVDVMNMAWGGICARDKVALNIGVRHKTSANIKSRKAFTLSVADIPHLKEADFFGVASANTMTDKFQKSGLSAVPSSKVDAPVIQEFPLTLECKVLEDTENAFGHRIVGQIVGVLADEKILDSDGKVIPEKLNAFAYDPFKKGYYAIGSKVGQAFSDGRSLMK